MQSTSPTLTTLKVAVALLCATCWTIRIVKPLWMAVQIPSYQMESSRNLKTLPFKDDAIYISINWHQSSNVFEWWIPFNCTLQRVLCSPGKEENLEVVQVYYICLWDQIFGCLSWLWNVHSFANLYNLAAWFFRVEYVFIFAFNLLTIWWDSLRDVWLHHGFAPKLEVLQKICGYCCWNRLVSLEKNCFRASFWSMLYFPHFISLSCINTT